MGVSAWYNKGKLEILSGEDEYGEQYTHVPWFIDHSDKIDLKDWFDNYVSSNNVDLEDLRFDYNGDWDRFFTAVFNKGAVRIQFTPKSVIMMYGGNKIGREAAMNFLLDYEDQVKRMEEISLQPFPGHVHTCRSLNEALNFLIED